MATGNNSKPVPIKDNMLVPQHKRMAAGGKPNRPLPTENKGPKTPA